MKLGELTYIIAPLTKVAIINYDGFYDSRTKIRDWINTKIKRNLEVMDMYVHDDVLIIEVGNENQS